MAEYRKQHGPFRKRKDLKEVPGVGDATFLQAAGFLRIYDGDEPLDNTWIHPESYPTARAVLKKVAPAEASHPAKLSAEAKAALAACNAAALAAELNVGEPTLKDILDALIRPGRDPRADLPGPLFRKGVMKLEDLQPGMELRGTVLNVVDFGAFVDVGVKESGLVHISRLSSQFVKHPHDVVSIGDTVTVWVEQVDLARHRVSLSMVRPDAGANPGAGNRTAPAAAGNSASAKSAGAKGAPGATGATSAGSPAAVRPTGASDAVPPGKKPGVPAAGNASPGDSKGTLRSFGELKQAWDE